jgi:hypothetical protein
MSVEIGPKLLELLHDVVPSATSIGLLVNPTNPNVATQTKNLQAAALKLGLQVLFSLFASERPALCAPLCVFGTFLCGVLLRRVSNGGINNR